nr:PREDICTED: sequestosome-1 isoform X1 [Bemisia tabaci]
MMDPEIQLSFKIYLDMGDDSNPEVRRFGIPQCNVTNYLFLKDKIRAMFPPLRNSTSNFKVSWKDDDGDLIAITSDEELLIALTEMSGQEIRKLYVSILPNSVDETQFPRGPANVANGTQHANVVCDHCAGPVQGYRYKCIQCPDFDLCANCEMRGAHSDHFMIRLSNPLPLSNVNKQLRPKQHVFGRMHKRHSFSHARKIERHQMQDISFQKLHRKHHNHAKKPSVLGRMYKTHFFAPIETELYKMHGMDFRKPYHKHHDPTKKRRFLGHMHKRHSYSTPDRQLFEMQDINAYKPHHKHHDRTKKLNKKKGANIWGPNSSRKRSHFTKGLAHRLAKMSRKHEKREARGSRHCRFDEDPHRERRTGPEGCPANAWFSNFLAQLSEMGVTGSGQPETPGQEPQHEPQQHQQHQQPNQQPPQQGQPGRQYPDYPNCTAISELVNGIVDSCLTNVGPIVEKLVDPMINPPHLRGKVPPPQPAQTSEKSGEKPKEKTAEFMEPPIIDLEFRLGDELLGSFSTESFKTCEKSKGTPSESSNQMDQSSDSGASDKEKRSEDDGKKQTEAPQPAPTQDAPPSIPRDQSMEVDGWTVLTSSIPPETASKAGPSSVTETTSTPNQTPSAENQPRVVPVTAPVENLYPSLSSEMRSQNPKVNESLDKMLSMGFSNNGGWLLKLLEQCNGEIEMVCQMLEPVVKQNQKA